MGAATAYAYLDTRVSIRAEGLLNGERLAELATQPPERIADTLRAAGFADLAARRPASTRDLEQGLISDYLDDLAVLLRPLDGAARDFLDHWKRRYEFINLKRCLRHHLHGLPPADLRDALIDLGPLAVLPVDDLVRAEDAEEVLRRLEGTPYAGMAREAREVYAERRSVFDLEAVLDRAYYEGLQRCYDALRARDRQHVGSVLGRLADEINLVWLLRYRFVFGLEPAHAYLLLVPQGRLLTRSRLLELVQLDSREAVLKALPRPLAQRLAEATSIVDVEACMDRDTQRAAARVLRRTRFNLARPFAYMVLRERQILKVHAALKGRLLGLDATAITNAATLPGSFLAAGRSEG